MDLVTEKTLKQGVSFLCKIDEDLNSIVTKFGNPPLWDREPGYATLLKIILEQQVSLASAAACYNKLEAHLGLINPASFLSLNDDKLREIGFSRQKTSYGRHLAEQIENGHLDLDDLTNKSNEEVEEALMKVKGIGRWTIDIYLLMALQRQDIWPQGDLALIKAIRTVKNIPSGKNGEHILSITAKWAPWRSVAARILWHFYLSAAREIGK